MKSKTAAWLLSFFLGTFGAHRFYLGYTGSAIVMLLLTLIGLATSWLIIGLIPIAITAIWDVVDFIRILTGSMKAKDGSELV